VHGGGKEISALQTQMGIEPRYADGVRITDAASLALVEMVLCGTVNKRLVRMLLAAGVDALGMSGVDRGLVRAAQMQRDGIDMGFTGEVGAVRGDVLRGLLAEGITPVIAPICLGDDSAYNVNADHVAGAVAAADGAHVPALTPEQTESLIAAGTIFGGMIPKVRTALGALDHGVARATITDLAGLIAGGGTVFTHA
jgi:acetylglutamate kinase